MSSPLIILASILAFFALALIPLMMFKGDRQKQDRQQSQGRTNGKPNKKRKKR